MAKGPFDGLEMDVIGPGQTPSGAAARIALPRPSGAGADSGRGASGYEDSIADSLLGSGGPSAALGGADSGGPGAVAGPSAPGIAGPEPEPMPMPMPEPPDAGGVAGGAPPASPKP